MDFPIFHSRLQPPKETPPPCDKRKHYRSLSCENPRHLKVNRRSIIRREWHE
jgi:hypothetical protein